MRSRRAKLEEEYEAALFRVLLHDAMEQEGKILLEELQVARDFPDTEPPEVALKGFTMRLDHELSKQRRVARQKVALATMRTVATSLVIVLAVFFTAMTTVSAFRTRVMNIWLEIRPEFTTFQLRGRDGDNASVTSMVVNWRDAYVPTYVPTGYEVVSFSFNEGLKRIVFESADEQAFIIYTELDERSDLVVDTENASRFEKVSVNGNNGTLVVKNNLTTIVWEQSGRLFMIQAQTDVAIAVRMAKGVRYIR